MRPGHGDFMAGLQENLTAIEREGKRKVRAEKREYHRSHVETLVENQEQIAKTIERLYAAVYQSPEGSTPEILMEFTRNNRDGFFSEEASEQFAVVLDKYRQRREVVQEFIRENRTASAMFEKCFGSKPRGRVEVIPGPMTIAFRCFDDEDYIAAYTHGVLPENGPGLKEQAVEKAKKSGGAAFPVVKVSELAGCVIAERVGNNFEDRQILRKRGEVKLEGRNKNTWQSFDYPKQKNADVVYIQTAMGEKWGLHLTRGKQGEVLGVRVIRGEGLRAISEAIDVLEPGHIKISVPTKQYAAPQWVELEFKRNSFAIFDHTKEGMEFYTLEHTGTQRVVRNESLSKRIRLHEEQHQFNKLFNPQTNEYISSLIASEFKTLEHRIGKYPEEAVTLVARKIAQIFRMVHIDGRARDEIIANIREGRSPEEIFLILTKDSPDSLYDFKNDVIALDGGVKKTYQEYFEIKVYNLTWVLLNAGTASFILKGDGYSIHLNLPKKLIVQDKEMVVEEVRKVLSEDYKKKLEQWTSVITSMKKAGYSEREIIPFLNMLPINRWQSSARRLLKAKDSNVRSASA